ncbi:MAG: sigma-70 family RNA polymerase sigma factor [Bermanella sp.]
MIESIWNTFHHQLLNFIISKVQNKTHAEDILQDVFVKVMKNIETLADEQKLQSWLYQICRYAIIDFYRSKDKNGQQISQETLDTLISEEENHEQQAQISRCLIILINELPQRVSELLIDSEIEQLKQKDIAQKYKITLSATKSRILRGRDLLKKKLSNCCQFEFNENGAQATCINHCGC